MTTRTSILISFLDPDLCLFLQTWMANDQGRIKMRSKHLSLHKGNLYRLRIRPFPKALVVLWIWGSSLRLVDREPVTIKLVKGETHRLAKDYGVILTEQFINRLPSSLPSNKPGARFPWAPVPFRAAPLSRWNFFLHFKLYDKYSITFSSLLVHRRGRDKKITKFE